MIAASLITQIKYFENYYLEMSYDSYLMEIWNCSLRHLASIPRTNNHSEAANRQVKEAVKYAHSTVWGFWEKMIKLQGQTDKRSEDFYGGTDPDPPRDNYWVMRDAAIIKLLGQLQYTVSCWHTTLQATLDEEHGFQVFNVLSFVCVNIVNFVIL